MSANPPEPLEVPEAQALLEQLANALLSRDPARCQIVIPSTDAATTPATGPAAGEAGPAAAPHQLSPSAAQARYRALVEQIPAVTFMAALDQGDNEMYVSPQIEALLGYSQKEWLDDPVLWFSRLHPDDRELWNQEFARGIATAGPFRAQCRVLARDGRVVWIHGEARLVRDDQGRPLFLQGIAFDITESKRAEEAMRDAMEQKAKVERLAAIGQLAASIGHDLRNPLAAIRSAHYYISRKLAGTELMKEPRMQQILKVVDDELLASNKIISDLLDFARERRLNLAACELAPLVDSAISVTPKLPDVVLRNEVPAELPMIDVDRDQLRQVLVNLIQNASEAIPAGRPGLVRVVARAAEPEVLIEIIDNGSGIAPENMQKILEPLFSTKARGTGLGLAIVAGIIRRHGGTLQIETTMEVGTTFRVALPRTQDSGA
jgi:PAS domain S-box-containing protein